MMIPWRKAALTTAAVIAALASPMRTFAADQSGMFSVTALSGFMAFTPASAVSSIIESIQTVTIAMAATVATNTATISSVDTSRSIVIYGGGFHDQNADHPSAFGRLDLTDATTVTATRGATNGATTVKGTVIQFAVGATTSVQQGTILLDNVASNTATISSVTTTLSAIFCQGFSGIGTSATEANYLSSVDLTDATTVTATRTGTLSTADTTVGFVVVEFAASYIQSVQHVSQAYTTNTSEDTAISAVTMANCWLAWGGFSSTTTTDPDCFRRAKLFDATTVRTQSGASATGTYKLVVIEFVSGVINSIQRFETAVADNVTTANQTITSVNTAKSIANFTGYDGQGDDPGELYMAIELTSATNVACTKGTLGSTSTDDNTINLEVIEFV